MEICCALRYVFLAKKESTGLGKFGLLTKKRIPVTGHAFKHSYHFGFYLLFVIPMYKKSLDYK
ncbi:hypothetical protein DW083_21765 [Parabacteroides sp. AF48-14]|nr:hypothetical protein DW083_21765 [Parabacteroides sp. AF48-14]